MLQYPHAYILQLCWEQKENCWWDKRSLANDKISLYRRCLGSTGREHMVASITNLSRFTLKVAVYNYLSDEMTVSLWGWQQWRAELDLWRGWHWGRLLIQCHSVKNKQQSQLWSRGTVCSPIIISTHTYASIWLSKPAAHLQMGVHATFNAMIMNLRLSALIGDLFKALVLYELRL